MPSKQHGSFSAAPADCRRLSAWLHRASAWLHRASSWACTVIGECPLRSRSYTHGKLESSGLNLRILDHTQGLTHGTCGRHRPGDDQLCRRRSRGRRARGYRQRGGLADHPVRGGLRQERRGARRRGRQAAGSDQRRPDDPVGQAADGHRLVGGHRRQEVHPAADQRVHPAEAEEGRRGIPRRDHHRRGDHRPGILQRRAAPGHQGGRHHRGPERAADHQRADLRGAGLSPGQGHRGNHPGLRPGRGHVRRLAARGWRGRGRGQGHQRRQPPRRRRLGPADRGLAGQGLQEQLRHRPVQGQDGAAAAAGDRGEGQDRAVQLDRVADQPALHHPLRPGPAAPGHQAVQGRVPEDDLRPARPLQGAVPAGDQGRRGQARATSTTWCSSAVPPGCPPWSTWSRT
jgi:hypothetical protein